jgi:acyl-CoA-binding protein
MELNQLDKKELESLFQKCYNVVRNTSKRFPQDTLLRFYSYYKLATNEDRLEVRHLPENGEELINAFKANAMFQVQQMRPKQAKIKYIKLTMKELDLKESDF